MKTGADGARLCWDSLSDHSLKSDHCSFVVVALVVIVVATIVMTIFVAIVVIAVIVVPGLMLFYSLMAPALGRSFPLAAFDQFVMIAPFRTAILRLCWSNCRGRKTSAT